MHVDGAPVDPAAVRRMLAAAAHRGATPQVWSDGFVALGVGAREDRAAGAMAAAGGCVLVVDGRIDNAADVLAALPQDLRAGAASSDAALLLAAYRATGTAAFASALGDFAVVLWDGRLRRLVLARDIIGAKPLLYAVSAGVVVCGSEMQQLFEGARVPADINEGMVAEHLCLRVTHPEETLYRDVMRVPAAHAVVVAGERVTKHRYYTLDSALEVRHDTDREYAEHFRSLLSDAIRCRLDTAAPVAAYLSGGLDSSSVVSLLESMRRSGQVPDVDIHALSVATPGYPGDESDYFRLVARRWDLRAREFAASAPDPDTFVDQVRRHRDVPERAVVTAADVLLAHARGEGCRTVFTGGGGDDWLSAYVSHANYLLTRLQLREFAAHVSSGDEFTRPTTLLRAAFNQGVWPVLPRRLRDAVSRARGRSELPEYVTAAFAASTAVADRLRVSSRRTCRTRPQQEILDWFSDGALSASNELEDRHHAAFGIEMCQPLNDRRIIEFGFAIPEEQRWRGDDTKFVLRTAMADLLPDEVCRRHTKGDYSSIFALTLERCGGEQCFTSLELARRGWVDGGRLLAMYRRMSDRFHRGDPMYAWDTLPLWTVYGTELWLRHAGG